MAFIPLVALPPPPTASTSHIPNQCWSLVPLRVSHPLSAGPNRIEPSVKVNNCRNHTISTTCSATSTIPTSTERTINTLTCTYLDNNGFVLRFRSCTIVIDPWLYDDLIFFSPLLSTLSKPKPPTPENDVSRFPVSTTTTLILTQGFPDHTHEPTLCKFPRDIPVFASPSCKSVLSSLQFTNVTYLEFGDIVNITCSVKLTALPGASVGPPWTKRQLATLLEFSDADNHNQRLCGVYHEPHGEHSWKQLNKYKHLIDIVIVPYVDTALKMPVINRKLFTITDKVQDAIQLCKYVSPALCIGFDVSKGENSSGYLNSILDFPADYQQLETEFAAVDQLKNTKLLTELTPMEELIIWKRNEHCDEVDPRMLGTSIGNFMDNVSV